MDGVRSQIKSIYRLPAGTEVFLCPSGSDAEYIPLLIAKTLNKGKKVRIFRRCCFRASRRNTDGVHRLSILSRASLKSDQAPTTRPAAGTFRPSCRFQTRPTSRSAASRWRASARAWRPSPYRPALTGGWSTRRTRSRRPSTAAPRRGPCPSSTASWGGSTAAFRLRRRHAGLTARRGRSKTGIYEPYPTTRFGAMVATRDAFVVVDACQGRFRTQVLRALPRATRTVPMTDGKCCAASSCPDDTMNALSGYLVPFCHLLPSVKCGDCHEAPIAVATRNRRPVTTAGGGSDCTLCGTRCRSR